MSRSVLTIWLCLSAHPGCPVEQSTRTPVVMDMDDAEMCETIANQAITVLPPPKGTVANHVCTPKDED